MPYAHSDKFAAKTPDQQSEHMVERDAVQRPKLEGGKAFVMHTEFSPAGDRPTAIAELSDGVKEGERNQVLLGATGTGKTYLITLLKAFRDFFKYY